MSWPFHGKGRPQIPWLHPALPSLVQGQDGQAVITVTLILMVAATFILLPFLTLLPTVLTKGQVEREQRYQVLAAEAALQRARGDLMRGADGIPTTYTTKRPGFPATTYTITTAYTPPSVTVSDYTPTVTFSTPTVNPAEQPAYIDPGLVHPQLAIVDDANGYLLRLYNVKAGTVAVNWAYSPAGASNIGLWAGLPLNSGTGAPYVPGETSSYPTDAAILTSIVFGGTSNQLGPVTVNPATDGSGGVYTIIFHNSASSAKTTLAFSATGGPNNTWVYANAYKDYVVAASVGASIQVSAFFRQVPGYSEPPGATGGPPAYSYTWGISNISFIPNEVFPYTWLSP